MILRWKSAIGPLGKGVHQYSPSLNSFDEGMTQSNVTGKFWLWTKKSQHLTPTAKIQYKIQRWILSYTNLVLMTVRVNVMSRCWWHVDAILTISSSPQMHNKLSISQQHRDLTHSPVEPILIHPNIIDSNNVFPRSFIVMGAVTSIFLQRWVNIFFYHTGLLSFPAPLHNITSTCYILVIFIGVSYFLNGARSTCTKKEVK